MPTTSSQSTWRLFIEARKKLTTLYEQPIATKGVIQQASVSGFSLEVDQRFTQEHFYQTLNKNLGINDSDIDKKGGCFYLDWQTQINDSQLEQLKDIAATCYFDYDPQPYLSGVLSTLAGPELNLLIQEANKINLIIKADDRQGRIQFPPKAYPNLINFLTTSRWKNYISIPDSFQIVLGITPDYPRYLDRLLFESGLAGKVSIRNKQVSEKDQLLKLKFKANVPVTDEICSYFETVGFDKGIEGDCHKFKSKLTATEYKSFFYKNHLAFKELLNEFVDITFKTGLKNDHLIFHLKDYKIFDKVLSRLNEIPDIHIFYRPEFTLASILPEPGLTLVSLSDKLKTHFPALELNYGIYGQSIHFRHFMEFNGRLSSRLNFMNLLDELTNNTDIEVRLDNSQRLCFLAKENTKLKAFQETVRFSHLLGEEFCIGQGNEMLVIGTLQKIKFPYLIYQRLLSDSQLKEMDLTLIRANLRGEREKIERLNQTMEKLAGDAKALPNPLTKSFVFDSSKARPVLEPELMIENGNLWQEIEKHSYQHLNPSQTRAVLSTLLAPDLALIQGPPGTGKSTAISQIIWHNIRRKPDQQILLTSETNMAVDNAIEKLEHPIHNLVKPIRIGKESNLESEGSRYALSRIEEWINSSEDKSFDDNAVARWLPKLAVRTKETLPEEFQKQWQKILSAPTEEIRSEAAKLYIKHSNVVASTGSYIGENNSEGKKTGFFRQYLKIWQLKQVLSQAPKGRQKPMLPKIAFDIVVMDEASKATPPELALPLTYAKKAIIIGDHRQLPPLLDEEEFETTLSGAGGAALARSFIQDKQAQISQFEHLFLNPGLDKSLVSRFNRQYRMHPHINEVIKQFYIDDGGLECGISNIDADDPNLNKPLSRYHGLFHEDFINPSRHLLWINVDEPEMKEGSSRVNFSEVEAVRRVLQYLRNSEGFEAFQNSWNKPEEKEVGLISFYGKQLFYLDQLRQEFADNIPIRVRTVDRFQGMERNIIIVSMVRSNKIISSPHQLPDFSKFPENAGYPQQTGLGFAEFPNRLNVALSRAKRLLVIVGNAAHFSQHDCYKRVFEQVQELGAVIDYKNLNRYS